MNKRIEVMLELQDAMNSKVNADWRHQGNAWYRAIWVECAELMDHYGWKWWKKQAPDQAQVELELIDIWHFGLSIVIEQNANVDSFATQVETVLAQSPTGLDFRSDLETFTLHTLQSRSFDVAGFCRLMQAVGLTFEGLYSGYIGKNVLNFFRQDHGYKEGTYIKVWHGKEDNEHLVEAVALLDVGAETFKDDLYGALKARYPA